jgi:putative intracellular protease/amidase
MTSNRALKTDIKNAGANFIDEGVVESKNYVTSQGLGDITEFVGRIADYLKKQ